MKNKEKYAKEIVEVACGGDNIAVTKEGERVVRCSGTACSECLFSRRNCTKEIKEWAESEYIEKQVISKKDRTQKTPQHRKLYILEQTLHRQAYTPLVLQKK